jgi:hypothetical protein
VLFDNLTADPSNSERESLAYDLPYQTIFASKTQLL